MSAPAMPGPCVWAPTPGDSFFRESPGLWVRLQGPGHRHRRYFKTLHAPFLCPKVFILLFFCCLFAFFLDPCRETFLWPKVFPVFYFLLCFCFCFFFFLTPAVKRKKHLYLCLYPLAHLHKVKFTESVAAYNSGPIIKATGSVKTKLRIRNTFVLTPSWSSSEAASCESPRAVPLFLA